MHPRHLLSGAVLFVALSAGLAAAPAPDEITAESARANAFFDRVFDAGVDRSPSAQGYLGIKKDHDKWDDYSEAHQLVEFVLTVQELAELKRTVRFDRLDEQTQLSYRLFVAQATWQRGAYLIVAF